MDRGMEGAWRKHMVNASVLPTWVEHVVWIRASRRKTMGMKEGRRKRRKHVQIKWVGRFIAWI